MKFGRKSVFFNQLYASTDDIDSLPRNQVPEWSASYINYKGLKKIIKAAVVTEKSGNHADLAGQYFILLAYLADNPRIPLFT